MRAAGATHLLHVVPMYNKPPQRGLVAHFRAIADAVDLPIILYNVPGRTALNMEAATTLELADVPGIVGIKEASGDLAQITEIIRARPAHFSVLSGDDALALAVIATGGNGVISVTSNATPRRMTKLVAEPGPAASSRREPNTSRSRRGCARRSSSPTPCQPRPHFTCSGRWGRRTALPLVPLAERHLGAVRASLVAAGALA